MGRGVRISEVTWQALIALRTSGVVDALQALASRSVAVADSVFIDVLVTVASLAELNLSSYASGVAVETVGTDLASRSW
jgi:hypothetical protein